VTREKLEVCVVPKLQGLVLRLLRCKTLLPREKKSPIDWNDHLTGEFGMEAHHGERCVDGRLYQVGIIRIPPTNFVLQYER
jgi:hypothetical protein